MLSSKHFIDVAHPVGIRKIFGIGKTVRVQRQVSGVVMLSSGHDTAVSSIATVTCSGSVQTEAVNRLGSEESL